MKHWTLVQADLMQLFGVRDDQAHQYSGPWFVNLVHQTLTDPDSRCFRMWSSQNEPQGESGVSAA